jgi:hypothetical protein
MSHNGYAAPNPHTCRIRREFPTRIAWMGGSSPRPFDEVSEWEVEMCQELYLEQCFDWMQYWREDLPGDVGAIFWHRARGDAHATFRVGRDESRQERH